MTSRLVPHGLGGHARTCALLLRPVIEPSILVSATLEAVPRGMDGPKEPPAPTGARFWAQVGVINLSSFLMGMALVCIAFGLRRIKAFVEMAIPLF